MCVLGMGDGDGDGNGDGDGVWVEHTRDEVRAAMALPCKNLAKPNVSLLMRKSISDEYLS